jgi:hypothetical protein
MKTTFQVSIYPDHIPNPYPPVLSFKNRESHHIGTTVGQLSGAAQNSCQVSGQFVGFLTASFSKIKYPVLVYNPGF